MLPAVGYIRVSTETQAERGLSLDAQTTRIKSQARALGLKLSEVVADKAISGKSFSRPGVARLLAAIKDGKIGAIIVWKLDRLTRSVRDLIDLIDLLKKHNVRLISITESLDTESAAGRMVMTILCAVAQMEREQTGERIRAVLQHIRSQKGRAWNGNPPYGFSKIGKRLFENKKERALCRIVAKLYGQGYSGQMIADELNKRGFRTRTNGKWRSRRIYDIINFICPRLAIKVDTKLPRVCKDTGVVGYRRNSRAHRIARMKVPKWRRSEIGRMAARAAGWYKD
jgi:site-specific DNA recombinase